MATSELDALSTLLTLVITTSPTPSAPSTELLSSVLQAFQRHCPAITACRVIVVFDAYDQIVSHPRLKKGQVTQEHASNYVLYKENVKSLILNEFLNTDAAASDWVQSTAEAEYGSPFLIRNAVDLLISRTANHRVTFMEPEKRIGFGLAVRSALRITETPYCFIQQHDWALSSDLPLEPLLAIMKDSEIAEDVPVKYICLPAVRMLGYATSAHVDQFPVLKELTVQLKRRFTPASQPDVSIPLTPLFFWHDKPHVASTVHYLARVFPTRLAMLRGDFIEDKVGQHARAQMKEGQWAKWATWLYYPDEGRQLCLTHLQGRTWRGAEFEAKQAAIYRQRNDCSQKPSLVGAAVSVGECTDREET